MYSVSRSDVGVDSGKRERCRGDQKIRSPCVKRNRVIAAKERMNVISITVCTTTASSSMHDCEER